MGITQQGVRATATAQLASGNRIKCLLPFAAIVLFVGLREVPSRTAKLAIIAYNAMWAVDSFVLLASGWVAPTLIGSAFVIMQAVTVGGFAILQWIGVKRADHG